MRKYITKQEIEAQNCYGCLHLTSKMWADGSEQYGCLLSPGLIVGMAGSLDNDEPMRCQKYKGG